MAAGTKWNFIPFKAGHTIAKARVLVMGVYDLKDLLPLGEADLRL
ncbi:MULTISPECIES: hypothetical protein [unclassified Marinobacter]|nr:hypothetical protein [Marinobacter sp. 1-4A]